MLSPMHYFPVTTPFMLLLGLVLVVVVALIQVGVISYAYEKMGIRREYIFGILLLTLGGSYVNIPIWEFPAQDIVQRAVVRLFGVTITRPGVPPSGRHHPGDQSGRRRDSRGAVDLLAGSQQNLSRGRGGNFGCDAGHALVATARAGLGIAISPLVAPIVAVLTAMIISRKNAAPVAYIAGSVGTLLGADILNLGRIRKPRRADRVDRRRGRGRRSVSGRHRGCAVGVGWDKRAGHPLAGRERRPTTVGTSARAMVGRRSLRDLVPPYGERCSTHSIMSASTCSRSGSLSTS